MYRKICSLAKNKNEGIKINDKTETAVALIYGAFFVLFYVIKERGVR